MRGGGSASCPQEPVPTAHRLASHCCFTSQALCLGPRCPPRALEPPTPPHPRDPNFLRARTNLSIQFSLPLQHPVPLWPGLSSGTPSPPYKQWGEGPQGNLIPVFLFIAFLGIKDGGFGVTPMWVPGQCVVSHRNPTSGNLGI